MIYCTTAIAKIIESTIRTQSNSRPSDAMRLTRGHDLELPTIKYEFNKQNFIVRSFLIVCDFVIYYFHAVFYVYL